jgi:hypothetical protein
MRKVKVCNAPIHPTVVRISDPRSRDSTLPFFFRRLMRGDNRSYTLHSRHEDHHSIRCLRRRSTSTNRRYSEISSTLKTKLPIINPMAPLGRIQTIRSRGTAHQPQSERVIMLWGHATQRADIACLRGIDSEDKNASPVALTTHLEIS